jgi:hypothetical protein
VLVLDIADDLLEHVFQRDHADDPIVAVADERHRPAGPLQ